jgi:GNAT superfamily N-acetyltransferase
MDDGYDILYVEKPEWAIIGQGITEYNEQQAGKENGKSLCFVLKGPEGEILGGVIGSTYWDWFHLDLMWLREGFRGRGYGRQLLIAAEGEARKRGAKNVYLDTFSFQAPGFYEKYGYRVFGELREFPAGHQRYFLTKEL